MWKVLVFLVVLTASALSAPSNECTDDQVKKFEAFKKEFRKTYKTPEQETVAMNCFCKADNEVTKQNSNPKREFDAKINENSDVCRKVGNDNGLKLDDSTTKEAKFDAGGRKVKSSEAQGFVRINGGKNFANVTGLVRNQGSCGNCWAQAPISVIQFYRYLATNSASDEYSVSSIVDCNRWARGCAGGDPGQAFQHAFENGVALERLYPTIASRQRCRISRRIPVAYKLPREAVRATLNGNEDALRQILDAYGPVTVGVKACNSLYTYGAGIYVDSSCTGDINHAVTLVGYGTERNGQGRDFWILKNSWGATWGENGYFRIERGKNSISVASFAWLPCPVGAC